MKKFYFKKRWSVMIKKKKNGVVEVGLEVKNDFWVFIFNFVVFVFFEGMEILEELEIF